MMVVPSWSTMYNDRKEKKYVLWRDDILLGAEYKHMEYILN